MSAALRPVDLPPEAISLIKEGTPKPLSTVQAPAARLEVVEKPPPPAAAENPTIEAESAVAPSPEPEAAGALSKPKGKVMQLKEPTSAEREALVSMTFRLPESILAALLRAASERKIKRLKPYSQQEIVAEALSTWLKRGGYL
jgi:hypothetical protein